jgi:hypothetical protein
MIVRRYYPRQLKFPYYFHPEITDYAQFLERSKEEPNVDWIGLDNAHYAFKLSPEEQDSYWLNSIKMIMLHTRWVLDNLDELPEYTVRWNYYEYKNSKREETIGKPPEALTARCDQLYNMPMCYPQNRKVYKHIVDE